MKRSYIYIISCQTSNYSPERQCKCLNGTLKQSNLNKLDEVTFILHKILPCYLLCHRNCCFLMSLHANIKEPTCLFPRNRRYGGTNFICFVFFLAVFSACWPCGILLMILHPTDFQPFQKSTASKKKCTKKKHE